MKRSLTKRIQKAGTLATSKPKDIDFQKQIIQFDHLPSKSASCPSFKLSRATEQNLLLRQTNSVFHIREHNTFSKKFSLLPNYMEINFLQIRAASTNAPEKSVNAVKNIGTVCACPAPNTCLPPPCNTPAKCLQYMTGYYYYPYGTWFCGPYHVSTGSCPYTGPVKPGGPCGPVLPCPCDPICCKPLTCCGVCGLSGPSQTNNNSNGYNQWHFGAANMYSSYNPYTPNPYTEYNSYNPYNAFTHYGYYSGSHMTPPNFGPCYNIPITPIPIPNPMASEQPQTPQTNPDISTPKSAICWPLSKANINQDTKVSSSKNVVSNASYTKTINPNPFSYPTPLSYDSKPTLSKANPYTKPRINARTLRPSNSIGICYFSTKCIEKYANKSRKLIPNYIKTKKNSEVNNTIIEGLSRTKTNSFNYWELLSNENNTKKQI